MFPNFHIPESGSLYSEPDSYSKPGAFEVRGVAVQSEAVFILLASVSHAPALDADCSERLAGSRGIRGEIVRGQECSASLMPQWDFSRHLSESYTLHRFCQD